MEALFNAMVALGLLLMLVLIIYLLDRINNLERETRRVAQSLAKPVQTDAWAGLSGRRLWDAMTGKPPDNMDAVTLADVRERYDLVLHRHIEALYQEGWRDGARGMSATPANTRLIATARGSVESWLPAPQANTFTVVAWTLPRRRYRPGHRFVWPWMKPARFSTKKPRSRPARRSRAGSCPIRWPRQMRRRTRRHRHPERRGR